MYDLHIHTNHSDGGDSPNSILQKAEKLGLAVISITDHDNCKAYFNLDRSLFSGRIITGIELDAYIDGLSIELLGYGFDVDEMYESIEKLRQQFGSTNLEMLKSLYERSLELGMKFPPNLIENYDRDKYYYATEYLHSQMREFPENKALVPDEGSWRQENIFFKRHTSNPASPFYINKSDLSPSVGIIVDTIHGAGGKVFIPHIYQYEEHSETLLYALLDNYDIDGIECFYPSFTQEQSDYLLDLCKTRNLLVSGGSDYHGDKRPGSMGVKDAGRLDGMAMWAL